MNLFTPTVGAVVGALLGAGIVLGVSGWRRVRRPALDLRVLPYVRDVHPYVDVTSPSGVVEAVFGPTLRAVADSVGGILGGSASVHRRLVRLGSRMTLEQFRVVQVIWGVGRVHRRRRRWRRSCGRSAAGACLRYSSSASWASWRASWAATTGCRRGCAPARIACARSSRSSPTSSPWPSPQARARSPA